MNLVQLSAFRAVMTSASLSEAARKLGRTQPAVSLAIRSLEDTLGMKLFERRGRQLVPVPEAQYLLVEAERVLDRLTTVSRTMQSLASGRAGSLRISAMPGPSSFLFPRFVADWLGEEGEFNVNITSRSSMQIEELVRTQSIDFGFCDAPSATGRDAQYETEKITAESYVALPRRHPLADTARITLGDLVGHPMGALQAGHTHREHIAERFQREGLPFEVSVESQTFSPLMHFVRTGRCLAIVGPLAVVSEEITRNLADEVVFRPLQDPLRYEYAILTPMLRPLSQVALSLKSAWREALMGHLEAIGSDPRIEERGAT
ncbi:LysR family transcriptional regulator [Roseovarius sp. A21]|uniref:LysR family transcriptional regulator n=1 Tax=Roseovarius bejariae TaxID=2576383 RepID=A0A844CTN5_9RHOB|nr:LysR family transcriptional regulator [Roseovarius bejariae]MRU14576.1 LysR family transcriptional regulator [Roseovarius bejariae]